MIDIHNHTLYGVDDGSASLKQSLDMLREAKRQGIDDVILTPHYRYGMFPYDTERVTEHFAILKREAEQAGIDIRLYLGCEYHVNSHFFDYMEEGRTKTLADTNYVLAEYGYSTEYSYICDMTREMGAYGYIPVIAHVERYECFIKKPGLLYELREMGAMIQINANSILGMDGRTAEKTTRKILKHELADIVASDTHDMAERRNMMGACRKLIEEKYSPAYARELFEINPAKVLEEYRRG